MGHPDLFFGILEELSEDAEMLRKNFMKTQLKVSTDTVNPNTIHQVHSLGSRTKTPPQLIAAKHEQVQHQELIKHQGREPKGTKYFMISFLLNGQHKVLHPILTPTEH